MKLTTTMKLELNKEEAEALKKLLAQVSFTEKKGIGLTEEQCQITSEIFLLLPDKVEEA